jgi:hypothetical protein
MGIIEWIHLSTRYHESLKAYLAPTGLVSEPRGDLTCRGDLRLEVVISVPSVGFIYFHSRSAHDQQGDLTDLLD